MRLSRTLVVMCFYLLGCDSSGSAPESHYFASDNEALVRRLDEISTHVPRVNNMEVHDASAPLDHAHMIRHRWGFAGVGWFEVRIRGRRAPGDLRWPICSIEIGPDVARRPFPLQKIYRVFDDPALARRVEAAIGPVDIMRPYAIEVIVDGFRVWVEQFAGRDGPTVYVVIDGCGRVAPRKLSRMVLDGVPELRFPDPPPE